jgi:hypothetical protein
MCYFAAKAEGEPTIPNGFSCCTEPFGGIERCRLTVLEEYELALHVQERTLIAAYQIREYAT